MMKEKSDFLFYIFNNYLKKEFLVIEDAKLVALLLWAKGFYLAIIILLLCFSLPS